MCLQILQDMFLLTAYIR